MRIASGGFAAAPFENSADSEGAVRPGPRARGVPTAPESKRRTGAGPRVISINIS